MLGPGLLGAGASPGATSTTRSVGARSAHAGMPVTDIVAGTDIARSPAYLAALRARRSTTPRSCSWPSPTCCPRSRRSTPTCPWIYDAFNVEADLKAGALPRSDLGQQLLADVHRDRGPGRHRRRRGHHLLDRGRARARLPPPPPARRLHGRAERHRLRAHGPQPGGAPGPPRPLAGQVGPHAGPDACCPSASRCSSGAGTHRTSPRPDHPVAGPAAPPGAVRDGRHPRRRLPRPRGARQRRVHRQVIERVKRTLLAAADVALNPVLHGSGTNLKVIEYLASGVPVVSTAFGVRGLDVGNGRHLLVAEPHEMVAAVERVFADPAGVRGPGPGRPGPGHRALRLGRAREPARPRGAAGPALPTKAGRAPTL